MITRSGPPLLVTGLPRSGTTWLARQLTRAPGLALAGREPMNPRAKQFALGGTLQAWTRLDATTDGRQRRLLRRVYRGLEPRVYSRYGIHQWAAPLPTTRLVVKDPFALLSLPLIHSVTDAVPVIMFREPAAMVASYRRMGWTPAVQEVTALDLPPLRTPAGPSRPSPEDLLAALCWLWTTCYSTVLDDLQGLPMALLVDHAEVARGGDPAVLRLLRMSGVPADRLGSDVDAPAREIRRSLPRQADKPALHNFRRTADEVAHAWRSSLSEEEIERVMTLTANTLTELRDRRTRLDTDESPIEEQMGTER